MNSQIETDRRWLEYARDVLTRDGGPMNCCVSGTTDRISRWPGYLGPNYASGRVLFVGAVHNEEFLFKARTIQSLGAAGATWIREGRVGDAAYLAAMRLYYPEAARFWQNSRGVFWNFCALRAELKVDLEQVAIANLAKCYASPEKKDPKKKYSQVIAECPNPNRFPLRDLVERLNPAIIFIATTSDCARLDGVKHDGRRVFQFENWFHGRDAKMRPLKVWAQEATTAYREKW